jgi:alpha-beta hydrolase superfamily lysophospholipase
VLTKWICRAVFLAVAVLATIVLVRAFDSRSKPDLKSWHEAPLEREFTVESFRGKTFDDYLAVEKQVFEELDEKVYAAILPEDRTVLNRFHRGSAADPAAGEINWNRSFEMFPGDLTNPAGGILLLHGLTDSPYSMRSIAEIFRDRGFYVLAARMPGHGTAPSGLLHAEWQDWMAVVRLGVLKVREVVGEEAPLYLGGYSNGGALAVKYTLDSLEADDLETPGRVFIYSPAIGITKFAAFATWHKLLSFIPYFEKFKWESIFAEYDPYKYNSFTKNAGHQSYALAEAIEEQMRDLQARKALGQLPPLIAFQSVVDSTIIASALVARLFDRFPNPGSELVLFDINRYDSLRALLKRGVDGSLEALAKRENLPFGLTLVTNGDGQTDGLVAKHRTPERPGFGKGEPLGLSWPTSVYSLSHVALIFPPDDPLYGSIADGEGARLRLGDLKPRGEKGVTTVPVGMLMRLRFNPFFDYLKDRTVDFCEACRAAKGQP